MGAQDKKFKVGDRVRFVETYANARIGDEGHVTGLWGDDGVNVVSNGVSYGCLAKRVELVEQPAVFTIEAGKFYKTRDGRKVGPIIANWADDKHWPFRWPEETMYYERGGFSCPGSRNLHRDADDLIAEWVDEPAVANDNAAPAKFKVGDRVRCLESYSGQFTKGKIYTVSRDHYGKEFESVSVDLDDRGSTENGWAPEFFELATQPTAIVALIENGQPKPATRPYVHATEAEATMEAERLALLHPGQEFGVYVLAGSKIADEVITKTAVLRAA